MDKPIIDGGSDGGSSDACTEEGGDEACTLETCTTNIDADAPDFYQRYFRCVTITLSGDSVVISSSGLPPHESFYYDSAHPNYVEFDRDSGAGYYQNPNVIAEQDISVTIPSNPTARGLTVDNSLVDGVLGSSDYEFGMGTVGVALDSVALFNALAGPGDDIADEAYSFDWYEGHPQQEGTYHYHAQTKGPLEVLAAQGIISGSNEPGEASIEVFGILCDGTVLLGCTELDGSSPADNLDSQNGHVHDLTDEAGTTHFTDRYHTHICPSDIGGHLYTPEIQYYDNCTTSGAGGPPA